MKLLFADAFPEPSLAVLREAGHEITIDPDLNGDTLPDAIGDHNILIVRSTKVNADTITNGQQLSMVLRAGAGTNTIDKAAAADAGVYVCNVPGQNSIAVAELAMGLLLAVDRRIADNVADLRNNQWDKKKYSKADGLFGKTLGIIGVGSIGLALAERARAFGITTYAVRKDGRSTEVENRIRATGVKLLDTTDELLATCDIISLHVPANDATKAMVDADFLAKMKPDAVLLNTSRGELIDEPALVAALDNGLRAGLDVYCNEPSATGEFNCELASHPNVVGTHHIGASTEQSQAAIAAGVIEVIESYTAGQLLNCVNMEVVSAATASLIVRHFDRVGVLAQVFDVLRRSGINVETMQNQIFAGSNAAVATIDVAGALGDDVLEALNNIDDVIQATSWKIS